jgi:hypothetical protein
LSPNIQVRQIIRAIITVSERNAKFTCKV